MLFKLTEHARRSKPLSIPHRAIVESNDDPQQMGRIKVTIPGILDGIPVERKPWIYPWHPPELGATDGHISTFMVPRVDSGVIVTFPYEDIYFGFYVGHWDTLVTKPFDAFSEDEEDYPNVYGFTDSDGNQYKVNMVSHIITLKHKSGTKLIIDAEGTVTIDGVKNINLLTGGTGVITQESRDPFTRRNHTDGSRKVKAVK